MDILYFVILSVVAIAALFFQGWLNQKERKSLLNRVMAKNFEELNYYETMFKGEVKELKDQRAIATKETEEEKEIKEEMDLKYKKEVDFIEKSDEDWEVDEIDLPALREKIKD